MRIPLVYDESTSIGKKQVCCNLHKNFIRRTCTENGEMDMQGGNLESTADVNPETSAGSDLSPVAPGASAQAELESTHKVVAKVAGIRRREAVEGTSMNPP